MLEHMMDWYDLTDEEREIRDLAREVARQEIAPRAEKHDEEGTFVRDSVEALTESGLLGANVAKEYGGLGGTPLAAVMALEAVSAACGSTGAVYLFHLNLCHLINRSGPEEVRQKYLPQLAKDKLGSFAINERVQLFREPFTTTLEEADGHLVVNGHKPFSTSAGEADVTVVQVQRIATEFGLLGQEYVLVDKGTRGLSARTFDPMGLRGASNGSITLENLKIPKENLLGEQPAGMLRAVTSKVYSVLGPNVIAAGLGGAALEAAAEHLWQRGAEEWQVQMLGTVTARLNALRAYNYFGARVIPIAFAGDLGPEMSQAHIEVQWLGGEDGPWICDRALELIGGSSFMRSSPIQRHYRDARGAAYLAFAMHHRRLVSGEILFATLAGREEPETMPWDALADYHFRMGRAHARNLPEPVRARFSRHSYEEFASSHGEESVSLPLLVEYLGDVFANAPQGPPPEAVPEGVGAPPVGAATGPPRRPS